MASYTEDIREQELVRLMEQYGDSVKRMCLVYLRDLSGAEDAAQDTFVKAYEHIDQIVSGEIRNEKAWLMRIAVNTCKDALRSAWLRLTDRRKPIEELPLFAADKHEEHFLLTQTVMALPIRLREIILLYYYQDINLRTCAKILNISPATATRRLQQAQKQLRIDMERG